MRCVGQFINYVIFDAAIEERKVFDSVQLNLLKEKITT